MIEEEFNFAAACDQVFRYQVAVKLKRLQEHEVESLTPNWRRRRRNVKRKHDKLDFDKVDDDVYFSMVCEESSSLYQKKSGRRGGRRSKKSQVISERKSSVDESLNHPPKNTLSADSLTSSLSVSTDEAVILKSLENDESASNAFLVKENCFDGANPTQSVSSCSRLRVKTAIELGISFAFLIESPKTESPRHNLMESAFPSSSSNNDSGIDSGMSDKLDLKIIAKLYQKYCTPEIREKLVLVAKTLKHIEKSTDETNASIDKINKSQSSDAEKLMMRFQTYGELNRKKNLFYSTLKDQFKFLDKVDSDNFELLFQILFLSTLKILTLQMPTPHKKGTLFKKILKLLSNCFESQAGKNDRIFNLLKKNSFRGDCLTLFRFLEKNKEDKFFEFLRVSDKEEEKTNYSNRNLNTSRGHFIHKDEAKMRRILPCGSHLMVQNASLMKLNYKTDRPVPVYQFTKKLVPVTNSQIASKLNLTTASFASNSHPTTSVLSSTASRIINSGLPVNNNQQVLKYTVKLNGPTVTFHPTDNNTYLSSLKNPSSLVNTREQTCTNVYRNPASHPGSTNFIPFPSESTIGNNYSFVGVQNYNPHNVTGPPMKNHATTEVPSTRLNETRHPAIESPNPLIGHTANETTSYQDFQARSTTAAHANGSSNNGPFTPLTTNTSNHIQQSRPSVMSITSKGKNNENRMPIQVPSDERPPTLKNLLNDGPLLNHGEFHSLSTHQNGTLNTSTTTVPKTNLHSTSKHTCSYKYCENDATVLCGGCSATFYCGNHCQKLDWVCGHDRVCTPAHS